MSSPRTEPEQGSGSRGSGRRKKTAFIAAPVSADTTVIRQILEREGIAAYTADELDLPGRPLSAILREGITQADIVVAVINGAAQSHNVFFELGFAQALKKPTLLIVVNPEVLPLVSSVGFPYLRTTLSNSEAIRIGLEQFLAAPSHGGRSSEGPAKQTRPLGPIADELLAKLRASCSGRPEIVLPGVIVEALQETGVTALSENSRVGDAEIDIAVWSDDLEPWVRNPLLIEVKDTLPGKGDLDALVGRSHRAMRSERIDWALVIYQHASFDVTRVAELHPNILFISVEQFLESLRDASFGDVIRKLRNQRVHGMS